MLVGGLQKTSLLDYPKKIAAIVFTHGCNFRCPYCHNPELVEAYHESLDEKYVLDFLATRKGKLDGIVVTGGEPCLQKDLPDFMQQVKDMGFCIKLDTNGSQYPMLETVVNRGLADYIAMDIKAPLKKYESVVCTNVNLQNIEKSIKLIMSSGADYEFRTTVTQELLTPDDFDEIGKMVSGAKKYFIQKFVASKVLNPEFMEAHPFSDAEIEAAENYLKQHGVVEVNHR